MQYLKQFTVIIANLGFKRIAGHFHSAAHSCQHLRHVAAVLVADDRSVEAQAS